MGKGESPYIMEASSGGHHGDSAGENAFNVISTSYVDTAKLRNLPTL